MSILIREVKILDPDSPFHKKTQNVFIMEGRIKAIDKVEHRADQVVEGKGKTLTPGWFDMQANFNDPGLEQKEDIASGCRLAAASGFTEVAIVPNTEPVIQTKSHVEYIRSKSSDKITQLYPIAAVTVDTKGEDLTEMIDLHHAGAAAFTDGEKPIWHTDILLKTLIYLQKVDGLVINRPEDQMLTRFGNMNEGISSTMMGLRGMPVLAEHLMIKRDLDILDYAGGKIHFSNISSGESVKLIKTAKNRGLNVTCDVSIQHLLFTDSNFLDYDPNYKVNPPFRLEKDRKALIKGLKEDVIDAIVSAHTPQDEESKKLEFDRAEFGMLGLQTVLPALISLEQYLSPEEWLPKISSKPRSILGVPQASIAVGQKVNLTLYDPKAQWNYDESSNLSRSKNSPWLGKTLKGKVLGTFLSDRYQLQ